VTPEQIRVECQRAREAGLDSLTLTLAGKYPRGIGFPRGELLCENGKTQRVYRFKVEALEKWAARMGNGVIVRTHTMSDSAPDASRVLEALHDHTWLPVIAAAADLTEQRTREVLDDLVRRRLAEHYTDELWGLR